MLKRGFLKVRGVRSKGSSLRSSSSRIAVAKSRIKGQGKVHKSLVQALDKLLSLKSADKSFSDWIKNRDNYTCVRCGKQYEKGNRNLTCSHFWGRGHKSTRFDAENNDALCAYPCHFQFWEKEKQGAYRDFKLNQLGEKNYEELARRAKILVKQKDAIRLWQDHLKEIQATDQKNGNALIAD